jgi:ribosomal protein S18 acetylase RimI-like enzyme
MLSSTQRSETSRLWVATENDRARSFYERHGFADDGTRVADPDVDGLVELRMVR